MNKRYDQAFDYIIRSEEETLFVEPYGDDAVWLSMQAIRDTGVKSIGASLTLETAIALRDSLDAVIKALALPQFLVEGYAINGGIGDVFMMKVRAQDEQGAIDSVVQQEIDNIVSLRCGDVEVIFDEALHAGE